MPVSHLNTSTTSLFASAVASLTDYTYSPLTQTPARYLATVLSGLTGGSYSHLTTPEHRLLALIATELSGTTVSQLTSSRAEMLAAIVNNPPEEGESVLEEIDEAGNTEITEYVNNDVTEVTTYIDFSDCTALTRFIVPSLTTVLGDGLFCSNCPDLVEIDLSDLETVVGNIDFGGTGLTAASFPALVSSGRIHFSGTPVVTASFPVLLSVNEDVLFVDCALNEASVDGILEKLASLDGTGGTTLYENRNVSLFGGTNAVPGAAGLTAKATLEGRGCTVTVNE